MTPLAFNARACNDVFDTFLHHEAARVTRGDLAPATLEAHRQILDSVWRPQIGPLSLWAVRYSRLVEVADAHLWTTKTYNNAISALRRAFDFGPRRVDRTARSRGVEITATQPYCEFHLRARDRHDPPGMSGLADPGV
jgi:hypothetical protein